MAFDFDLFSVSDEEYAQGMEAAAEADYTRQERIRAAQLRDGRAYVAWTEEEERRLMRGFRSGLRTEQLAARHRRSETAIAKRLERLGVDRGHLIAMDFEAVVEYPALTTPEQAAAVARDELHRLIDPQQYKDPLMHLNLDRLMLLLAIHRGTLCLETRIRGSAAADLSRLTVAGLVEQPIVGMDPRLTPAGEQLARRALAAVNEGNVVPPARRKNPVVELDESNGGRVLADERFYLVARGEVSTGQHAWQLVNAPRVVHADEGTASGEAERLAKSTPGKKFFVLQAVAVHKVEPNPATAKRL